MQIEKRKISDLKYAEYNPRKRLKKGDPEYIKLRNSIEKFGYVEPVIVNERTGNIVGGHQRITVLKDIGEKEADCVIVNLDEQDEKALNIALNKISGEWDSVKLEEVLRDLKLNEYDVELTGFDLAEIDGLLGLQQELEAEEDDFDVEAEKPKEAVSKYGQIYKLGRHRLMCGDSTTSEDVEKLMNSEEADMVFTDPPYNIDYKGVKDDRKIKNDKMADEDFLDFLQQSIMACGTAYVCCSWQYAHLFRLAMENIGMKPKAMIVWNKVNPAQHLDKYFKQHEIIWYFGEFGGQKTLRGDIWELKRQKNTIHPTMKPVELIAMALQDQPNKKRVYDGFGGSGSTLIACEQLNRVCYMMELDPIYVDVIIKRWEKLTGEKAELVEG